MPDAGGTANLRRLQNNSSLKSALLRFILLLTGNRLANKISESVLSTSAIKHTGIDMSKILGEKVDIIDECTGVSQLLGVRVYAYGQA